MAPPARAGAALGAPRSTRLHARGPGRGGRRGGAGPAGAARAGRDGDRSPPRSPGTGFHILWRRAARRHCPLGQVPTEGSSRRSGSVGRRAPGGRARRVPPVAPPQRAFSATSMPRGRSGRGTLPALPRPGAPPRRGPQEVLLPWCGTRSTSLTRRRPWHGHLQGLPNEGPGEGRIRVLADARHGVGTALFAAAQAAPFRARLVVVRPTPSMCDRGSAPQRAEGLCRQVRHERSSTTSRLLDSDTMRTKTGVRRLFVAPASQSPRLGLRRRSSGPADPMAAKTQPQASWF